MTPSHSLSPGYFSPIHRLTRPSLWAMLGIFFFAFMLAGGVAYAQRPYGIDVSSSQGGSMNWGNIKTSGISFAWVKATEGGSNYYTDPDFTVDENGAAAAGVLIGAYHYARYDLDTGTNGAAAEAEWFWHIASGYIKTNGAYIMPMLDVEDAESSQVTYLETYNATAMSQWVNAWCTTVSNLAAAGGVVVKPVIYSSSSFSATWFNSTVTQWIPWIADWNGENPQTGSPTAGTGPWGSWTVWQYDDTNTMFSGPPPSCDVDVFNGSATQLTNTLVIGKATSGVTNDWDPGHLNASPGSGGSGTWDDTTTNWWLSGTGDGAWGGNFALFAGTSGTVTLGASVSADGLTFATNGYIIAGADTLTLNGAGTVVVPTGTTNSIECVLGGAALNLSGGGVLYLNNSGNFTAGENIVGPNTTLQLSSDHPSGNDGVTINLSNGGIYQDLDSTNGDEFLLPDCAAALLTGGGIFSNPNGNLSMTNWITGAGSLTTIGTTFTLTLTCTTNNYTGGTIVPSGTLKANAAGVLGSTSGAMTVSGGTLDLGGASHTAGVVTVSSGTLKDGTVTGTSYAGQGGTISANLAGSAAMTKTTTNTLILSGTNTYTGITTISNGLLQISSDTNLGTAPGSAVANQLTLNSGTTTNNYGLRATASFTLNAHRGITLGASGGAIQVAQNDTLTYGGIITGSGNFEDGTATTVGYGTLVLSGANTYTGTTTIAAGTLQLGASGSLPSGTPITVAADNAVGAIFDLNGFSQTIGSLASSTGIGGTGTDTPTLKLSGALTIHQTTSTAFNGIISGSGGSLTLNGSGTLTLNGTNTYTGPTTISAGTLALGSNGSINGTPTISVAAGATFDVSNIGTYTLSGSTTLSASGTSTAATIKGANAVNLGSRPIILAYDGSHPALSISQGGLSLNGNSFTVNGSVLSPGTYTLIQQASGSVTGTGTFAVSGTAIGAGTTGAISVSGGNVNLVVKATPVFSNLSTSPSVTYGSTNVTLAGTVSAAGPLYPTNGETVTITINGNAQTTAVNDSTGDFSLNYNPLTIPASATPYTISYSYAGDGSLNAAANNATTLTVNQLPVILTGTRPYDGTNDAPAAILSVANKVGSDVVIVASGVATLAGTNTGPQTITSVGTLTLGGAAATNYTLAGASGTVTITGSSSGFSITGGSVDATGSNFVITWQSSPGTVYQVVSSTNPATALNTWSNVGAPITATNTSTSATNPISSAASFFDVISP